LGGLLFGTIVVCLCYRITEEDEEEPGMLVTEEECPSSCFLVESVGDKNHRQADAQVESHKEGPVGEIGAKGQYRKTQGRLADECGRGYLWLLFVIPRYASEDIVKRCLLALTLN
jgi:hypothetical protein